MQLTMNHKMNNSIETAGKSRPQDKPRQGAVARLPAFIESRAVGFICWLGFFDPMMKVPPWVSAAPHGGEANWHISICSPAGLRLHPPIIDDLLAQFGKAPSGCECRCHMIG